MNSLSLTATKKIITLIFFFTISFIFFPFTSSVFELAKWWLLCMSAGLLLLIEAIVSIRHKKISITFTPHAASFFMLTVATLASSVFISTNKLESLANHLGPLTFLSFSIIFSLGFEGFNLKNQKVFIRILLTSATLLSLFSLYQALGIGKMLAGIIPQAANILFTPVGSVYTLISVLCILLPLVISACIDSLRDKEDTGTKYWISLILICLGIGVTVWQLIQSPLRTLPHSVGWSILLEKWKLGDSIFLGVGPENFLSAYTISKPLWLNNLPFWKTRFMESSNLLFHISTTTGLLGLVALMPLIRAIIFPLYASIAYTKKIYPIRIMVSMLVCLISFFITPPNIMLISIIGATVTLCYPIQKYTYTVHLRSIGATILVSTMLFCTSILLISFSTKNVIADVYYYRVITEEKTINQTLRYKYINQAIFWNPTNSDYRIIFSQLNAALADKFISEQTQPTTPKTMTDSDRVIISKIIQQSIKEANTATDLAPNDVRTWENLARLYSAIASITQGADTWIESSFKKALSLDPTNPSLYTEYGNYLFAKKQLDPALQAYIKASTLKPDYPDAHFNIGYILIAKKQYKGAAQALTTALSQIPPDRPEYKQTQSQLEQVKQLLSKEELQSVLSNQQIDYSLPVNPTDIQTTPSIFPHIGEEEPVNQSLP